MSLTPEEMQVMKSVQNLFEQEEQAQITEEAIEDIPGLFKEALSTEQLREDRRKEREKEERLKRLRESCQVQVPTVTLQGKSFHTRYKESMGATKRKLRAHTRGSRLRKKRLNADAVEAAEGTWERIVESRKQGISGQPEGCSRADYQALCQYLTEDAATNQLLLPEQMEEGRLSEEQGRECIRQYMELDLKVDLRTDETIARESVRLEELTKKTEAIQHLLKKHPELTLPLTKEEKEDLAHKVRIGEKISNYYQMQKKVMTNSWYRTHYNSEISHVYHEEDTLEQRNLTILLWQAEYLRAIPEIASDNRALAWLNSYMEESKPEEERIKQLFAGRAIDAEYGKNETRIEDSRHADYFRAHNVEGDPIHDRLTGHAYGVNGERAMMNESFVRHLSNLPRWKAVQHMDEEQVRQMVENLVRTPKHWGNAEEVEACRRANLQGMRMFKEQLKKQVHYLKRKYGNGFLLMSAQEMAEHSSEFENDFTNMQGLGEFIDYLKRLPGMFDAEDPEDQEMEEWIACFETLAHVEANDRKSFLAGIIYRTYSDYKRMAAVDTAMKENSQKYLIKHADTEHLDVRWNTPFDPNDIEFEELINLLKPESMPWFLEELKETYTEEQLETLTWNQLAAETRHMTKEQAAAHLIDKKVHITEETRREWKAGGLDFGAASYFNVGTDDFTKINKVYKDILDHAELRERYGITSPELLQEFQRHLDANGECKVFMATEDACINAIIVLKNQVDEQLASAKGEAKRYLQQIANSLEREKNRHEMQKKEYTEKEMNPRFYGFAEFRERINMWLVPEHRAIMEGPVEEAIRNQQPDAEITVSGITMPIYEEVLGELLAKRKLKEGTDPEEYRTAVETFNREYSRAKVLIGMVNAYDENVVEPQKLDALWENVPRRMYFQFDIVNRHASCVDRVRALYERLDDMTEKQEN